jgi:hypothetical protein
LCFLFNKIREEGRTSFAWKRGGWKREERGQGWGERKDYPNNVCTHELMNKQ